MSHTIYILCKRYKIFDNKKICIFYNINFIITHISRYQVLYNKYISVNKYKPNTVYLYNEYQNIDDQYKRQYELYE